MMTTKIVQLLPDMELGGVERGVIELSRELVTHEIESHVISRYGVLVKDLLANGGHHTHYDCGSKNIVTLPYRAYQLHKILSHINPSIIHVRSRVPAWLLFCLGAHRRWPIISTCHGMYSVNRYSAQMTKAQKVICPSTAMVEYVKKNYQTPEDKIRLIHRGIDFNYFDSTKIDSEFCNDFIQHHRLQDKTIIALVGRLSSLKGHLLFLQAFAQAYKSNKNVVALIVGGDDKNPQRLHNIKNLAQQLGISDSIRYAGTQRQMREIYSLSHVLISASTKPEAFGRTTVEALAMQCPTIAPAHGGALDIIRHGENGLLFTPNNKESLVTAMLSIFELPKDNLRQSVREFSLDNMTKKTMSVYKEVLEK